MASSRRGPPRVALFNVSAHGHVAPTLGIVQRLTSDHGAKVHYFCYGGCHREAIEVAGAEYVETAYEGFSIADHNPGCTSFELCLQPAAVAILPGVIEKLKQLEVDIVVHELFSLWGAYAATFLGLPQVCLVTTPVQDDADLEDKILNSTYRPSDKPNEKNEAAQSALMNMYGIDVTWKDSLRTYAPRTLVLTTKSFQPPFTSATPSESFVFVGPVLHPAGLPQVSVETEDFLKMLHERRAIASASTIALLPVVLVCLGTVASPEPKFWAQVFSAGAECEALIVAALGNSADDDRVQNLVPPENVIVSRWVPQVQILRECANGCFVTHAGNSSLHEALLEGVPMICLPQQHDQFGNASRVEDLGAGILLDPLGLTTVALRDAIKTLLADTSYREAAVALGENMRSAPGASGAAQEIISAIEEARSAACEEKWV